jgi:hypothetical protein
MERLKLGLADNKAVLAKAALGYQPVWLNMVCGNCDMNYCFDCIRVVLIVLILSGLVLFCGVMGYG